MSQDESRPPRRDRKYDTPSPPPGYEPPSKMAQLMLRRAKGTPEEARMRALLDDRGSPPAAGVPPDRALRDLVDDALRALLRAAETLPIDVADIDTMFQTLSTGVLRSEASVPGFLHDAYPASRLIVDAKWHRGEYGPGQLEPEIRRHHILRLEAERTIQEERVGSATNQCKENLLLRLREGLLVASAIVEGDAFATRKDLPAEVWTEWDIDDVEHARTFINGVQLRALLIRMAPPPSDGPMPIPPGPATAAEREASYQAAVAYVRREAASRPRSNTTTQATLQRELRQLWPQLKTVDVAGAFRAGIAGLRDWERRKGRPKKAR